MLGAAVVIGAAGLGATTAQAQEFGFQVRGPVAYVPPCPGPGYVWVNGYMDNGYWVEGYRNLPAREYRPIVHYERGFVRDWDYGRERGWDRDRDRGWDRDRGRDPDGDRDRRWNGDRDHDRYHR